MKRTKWLALFGALALVLAACSPSDADSTTTTSGDDGGTATTEDGGTTETTEAPDTGATAGSGGDLLILQWQAPSQANALMS